MKICPTCDKTFEDSMKFCQLDGTTLVDDEPAFDPYATIVSTPANPIAVPTAEPEPEAVAEVAAPVEEAVEEPIIHQTVGSIAIAPPDDVLDLPEIDPLKTMYASDTEMEQILSPAAPAAEEPAVEEIPAPEPPSFIATEAPAPGFGDMAPPPSPFSTPEPEVVEETAPEPIFEESAPAEYDEPATMMQPSIDIPFVPPAPVQEWTPPPAPDAAWQNQEIGSNTPFQPPPAGTGGESQGLAIGAMVCGILSCLCCVSVITGPLGMILGFIAKKKVDEDPAQYGGRTFALVGMITGGIGFVVGVALIILQVFFGVLSTLAR